MEPEEFDVIERLGFTIVFWWALTGSGDVSGSRFTSVFAINGILLFEGNDESATIALLSLYELFSSLKQ